MAFFQDFIYEWVELIYGHWNFPSWQLDVSSLKIELKTENWERIFIKDTDFAAENWERILIKDTDFVASFVGDGEMMMRNWSYEATLFVVKAYFSGTITG